MKKTYCFFSTSVEGLFTREFIMTFLILIKKIYMRRYEMGLSLDFKAYLNHISR